MPVAVQIENSTVGRDMRVKKIQYIGQQTTQIFYDKAGVDWNKRLTLVSDLRPESLKLGDNIAATFPYVITPIQEPYNIAIQALHDASDEAKRSKHGILILGESNAGKTRLALEALRKTLPTFPVLRWWPDYMIEHIPPVEFLSGKHLVLLIDDIQDYVPSQLRNSDSRGTIFDSRATALRTLIEILLQVAKPVVIIATCRTEDKSHTQIALNWLFSRLSHITIPTFNINTRDPKAAQTIAEFQQQGPINIEEWDGTLGSLVLGLASKNSQYLAMAESKVPSVIVLQAMKLLTLANTTEHTERRLKKVCAEVFFEKELQENEKTWREAVNQLTLAQFITEEIDEDSQEVTLVIRKDIYFEKVVTDYPQLHRPHQLMQDFVQLQKVLVKSEDISALISLGYTLTERNHFEKAITRHSLSNPVVLMHGFTRELRSACCSISRKQ
jgi:hypothetical protein